MWQQTIDTTVRLGWDRRYHRSQYRTENKFYFWTILLHPREKKILFPTLYITCFSCSTWYSELPIIQMLQTISILLSQYFTKHWRTLSKNKHIQEIFPQPPIIVYKQSDTFTQVLCRAKLPTITRTQRYTVILICPCNYHSFQ